MLLPQRKSVHGKCQNLLGRQNQFEGREGIEPLFLADVVRPRQSAYRGLFHVVLKDFREEQFVAEQRPAKINSWSCLRDADHRAVLAENRWNKILYIEIPLFLGRLGFDGCQSAREAPQSRVKGSLVDRERLHGIRGHRYGKASGHGIGRLRGIHKKQALIFVGAPEREFSILRFHHAWSYGNYFPDLFLRCWESDQFAVRHCGFRVGNALRRDNLILFLDLNLFGDSLKFQSKILYGRLSGCDRNRLCYGFESLLADRDCIVPRPEAFELVMPRFIGLHTKWSSFGRDGAQQDADP